MVIELIGFIYFGTPCIFVFYVFNLEAFLKIPTQFAENPWQPAKLES